MKTLRIIGVVALATALNLGLVSHVVHAAPGSTLHSSPTFFGTTQGNGPSAHTVEIPGPDPAGYPGWYDINAYDVYCPSGGTSCATGCPTDTSPCNFDYAALDVVGPTAGATFGTPGFVYMACAQGNPDGQYTFGWAWTSTAAFNSLWYDYYEGSGETGVGAITGKATLLTQQQVGDDAEATPPGSETLTASTSSVSVTAYDPLAELQGGTIGTATGVQNTDNTSDTPQAGGFTITIRGWLESWSTGDYHDYFGTISCRAGGANASVLGDYFAANSYPWPGDNFYGAEGEMDYYPFTEWNNDIYPLQVVGIGVP